MGPLTPPSSGAVYLDANAFIYSVEKIEPQSAAIGPIWGAAKAGTIEIVSSEPVFLETLVKPIRERDTLLENFYRVLYQSQKIIARPSARL